MRAVLRRSGGFAGVARRWEVGAGLTAAAAERIRVAAAAAGFFGLPAELRAAHPAPDAFTWTVEIEDGARRHAVRLDEPAASEGLLALVQLVRDLAEGTAAP